MEIIASTEIQPSVQSFIDQWHNSTDYIEAHTSGSTGTPKQIHLPKQDMLCSARATCQRFNLGDTSIMVCPLSIDYIAGKMMIVRALYSGADLYLLTPSNDLDALNQFSHIELLAIVPSQVPSLLKLTDISLIKNIIIGGAQLDSSLENELIKRNVNAFCTYGMTETCSHIALRKIGEMYYKAMPDITFTTSSDNRLIINAPLYTFSTLDTHDIVKLIDSTHFQWIGRSDNIINSGGLKISPEAVEQLIAPYMRGLPFYISSQPSTKWGNEIILLLQSSFEPTWLQDIIDLYIPKKLRPKHIYCLPSLNTTYNGKLRRNDNIKNIAE